MGPKVQLGVAGAGARERGEARATLASRGRRLQFLTLAWNAAEFVVAVVLGLLAGSVALVGFGFDSAIELGASLVALWRLGRDGDTACREGAERRAQRLIGLSFLLLAGGVLWEGVQALLEARAPEESPAGVVLAAASLVVMPLLARLKRRVAAGLDSDALHAESRQTEICAWLSAILLGGLGLNAWLGWWWADPVAGLAMVPLIARDGVRALRGRSCCG